MQIGVAHGGNGPDGLDHMADDVDDGQVDDGPVDDKLSLRAVRDALLFVNRMRDVFERGHADSSPQIGGATRVRRAPGFRVSRGVIKAEIETATMTVMMQRHEELPGLEF